MLAMIELSYEAREKIKSLDRSEYQALREQIPGLGLEPWNEGKEQPYVYTGLPFLVDLLTDGPYLVSLGLQFEVKRFKGTYRSGEHKSEGGVSYALHVAIPAIGLLTMNEVILLDDACTDNLQAHLDEGWRIIAVCPPDAKRRPDYILGRAKETH